MKIRLLLGAYNQRVVGILNNQEIDYSMPPLYSNHDGIYARVFAATAIINYEEKENEPPKTFPKIVNFKSNIATINPLDLVGLAIIGETQHLFERAFSNSPGSFNVTKAVDDTKMKLLL